MHFTVSEKLLSLDAMLARYTVSYGTVSVDIRPSVTLS